MLKWVVSGGSGGKGSQPPSGRSTPLVTDHTEGVRGVLDDHLDSSGQMDLKREVNNNDNMEDFEGLPPLPPPRHASSEQDLDLEPPAGRNRFIKGSDPLYQTARGRLQSRRSRLNDQINRELRLRSGAENLLKATSNRKMRETVALELSFVNCNLQLLKEEMSDLNSSVDIYQGNNCAKCIPMIPLGLKETKDIDFVTPLKEVLSEHYHEKPDAYLAALEQIQTVRQACRTPVRTEEGVELLFKYYNHLYFVEKRLFVPHKNIGIHFEWYDSLTGVPSLQRTVGFEKGSILFNIGALLTQIGARQDRTQVDGLEGAGDNFQKAAGSLKYLRDHFTHAPSKDMQAPTLDMLIQLLLAQSQECLFERRLLSGVAADMLSHITMAHEASMVSDMYKETYNQMVLDPVSQYTPTPWVSLVQAKTHYYKALAHYHAAVAVLDQTDSQDVDKLADHFDNLHVWKPNRKQEESVAAKSPADGEERTTFAKAHLRQSVLANEDALRVHNQSRQLRKIDTFQDVLNQSHDRSLQKFSSLEEEDDFTELLEAPEIQPKTDAAASLVPPDFSQYKVEDLLYNLGPLAIFSARHQWLPPRTVEMDKAVGEEFGFSVRGDSPVIIAAVEPGSKAQNCGMKVSDFIVGVGSVDTRWHRHEETVSLIRQAGSQIILRLVTPLDRNYLEQEQAAGTANGLGSVPPTPNMSQRPQSAASGKDKKTSSHKKTGSGSSGSGWTLRRKRSSSKEKGQQHLLENGKSEIHGR